VKAQLVKSGTAHTKPGIIESARQLDDLAVFVRVARHESFVEASREAGIPRSSVSRAVARLEDELGVPLLRRTTRQVAVTEDGRQLLLQASPHLEGLHEALASTADRRAEPSGLVRVTAPTYTGATRLATELASFAMEHPQIKIEIDPTSAVRDLIADGYDFAVRVGPVTDADFVARRLWQAEAGLFATPEFARSVLGRRARVTRADLERGPCVMTRATEHWRFRDPRGRPVVVKPNARFAVNDPRATVEVARQGLGFVLAPVDAVTQAPAGLVALKTDFGEPQAHELYVVYPTRRLLPTRVRLAIDWLLDPRPTAGAHTLRK
jgi:LysR family transcriptional regulator, transcriptional activator AphB